MTDRTLLEAADVTGAEMAGAAFLTENPAVVALAIGLEAINRAVFRSCGNCSKRRSMSCPTRKNENRVPGDNDWCAAWRKP